MQPDQEFRAFRAIDEFDGETLDNLDQLYQITRRWEPLREILEKELAIAEYVGGVGIMQPNANLAV